MSDGHWTREDLIRRLYCVGPEDGHLDSCARCKEEWESLRDSRVRLLSSDPGVSKDFLFAQRRSILTRLGEPRPRFRVQLLPAMAAVLLFLVVMTVFKQVPRQVSIDDSPDTQLYQEVLTMVSGTAPSAMEPLQSLFEVEQ
jgi:hypothetical protein